MAVRGKNGRGAFLSWTIFADIVLRRKELVRQWMAENAGRLRGELTDVDRPLGDHDQQWAEFTREMTQRCGVQLEYLYEDEPWVPASEGEEDDDAMQDGGIVVFHRWYATLLKTKGFLSDGNVSDPEGNIVACNISESAWREWMRYTGVEPVGDEGTINTGGGSPAA